LLAAERGGADLMVLCDTNGGTLTSRLVQAITAAKRAIAIPFGIHAHNDSELAVANSLAAVGAGARQVECTINGLGERAGNASLEEIVMALRTRQDAMPYATGVKTELITRASRLVSTVTGFVVQPNKAIVGANAFAHESGIHQDGMLKHAGTYEIMTPESVGLNRSKLVMGKHSGRHAFRTKLQELGFELDDAEVNDAFARFKDLADRKKEVFDEDIVALVEDEALRAHERIRFVSLQVIAGSKGPQTAELELEIDGAVRSAKTTGNGPVDATFNAIKSIVPHAARLQLFQVHAVTEGTDAQAEVTVRLEENGKTVNGQGADPDTLVASARAYLHALNKLMTKRAKTAPAALSA
jgi:2-isopropylmalate synthase